jgi:N-acyl homoserine lactone hydrolase
MNEYVRTRAGRGLTGPVRRLYALVFGWEPIPESVSIRGGRNDFYLLEPVTGAAIVYDDGWVLIDTGFNPKLARDPELRAAHYTWPNYTAVIPPGDPLVDQVEVAGLDWGDLAFCAISHLHCDHGGGLRLLVDGPPVVIQRREHEFAMERAGLEHAYFRTDYEIEGLDWLLVDGDVDLAPGLKALDTRGHTPGHMSFAVELSDQTIVLACDAADLMANITGRTPCGVVAESADLTAATVSIERLAELAEHPDTEVWPGHDPTFWETRNRPPMYYA